MAESKYYVVKQKAVPEVLLKVVEAKRLLDSGKARTVHDAAAQVGISRSSFYKYQDDIFPFHDDARGRTVTVLLQMEDVPGLLASVLRRVAESRVNVLTIHQTIPVNGVAMLTLSIEVLPGAEDVSAMLDKIEHLDGVHDLKILARE